MGEIVIHRGAEKIDLFSLIPFVTVTNANHIQEILSVDKIEISLESTSPMVFYLGDYIIHESRKFTLNMNPKMQKINESHYIYNLNFEGVQYDLLRKKYFNYDAQGFYTTGDFPLTGEINVFLAALLNNAERDENEYNWILGDYPQNTETKTITFDNANCLGALQTICQEFDQEFEIIQNIGAKTNTLNVNKIGTALPYSFEYGMGNGLYGLSRDNVSEGQVITRLYPFGSTENIPTNYRDFSPRLKLPQAYGNYIQDNAKVALYGLVEEIKNYDDIKPTFKGVIASVGALDANKGTMSFVCNNIDFDLNEKKTDGATKYLIAGTPAKIHVNKGNLAGYEFELHKYTHATKTLEVKQFIDDRNQKFPDTSTIFTFAPGDEFTFIDIIMPDVYITNAENKLKETALEDYEKLSQNNVKYSLDIDPLFFAAIGGGTDVKHLGIGDYVTVKDSALGINKTSRIITLSRDMLISNGYKYSAEISDSYEIALVTQILQDIQTVSSQVETVIVRNKEAMLSGYRRMKELQGLVFDTDGYFDPVNIKPNSIETNMLTVGAKSQQLTLESVVFTANKNNNQNLVNISNGKLIHFSIDETAIREWSLLGIEQPLSTNSAYYVYARVPRGNNTGSFLITTERRKFDSEANFYNFLVAVLFSPQNGIRLTELMYGSTFIHGRTITSGRIQSIDGLTWFDLDTGQMKGKIEFLPGSPAFDQINNSLVVGGRNFVKNSYINADQGVTGRYTFDRQTVQLEAGKYILSVKGFTITGENNVQIYNDSFSQTIAINSVKDVKKINLTLPAGIYQIRTASTNVFHLDYYKLERGNVATDWTPAPEDIQEAVTNAENSANTANSILADISDDNKITAQEKQALKKEYDVIVAEKPQLQAQAATYGASVTNYVNAYNNLVIYTNPLLVNLSITSDIVGSVLRSTYATYYTAKVNLLKYITDMVNDDISTVTDMVNEAQQTADAAWNQLTDIASDSKLTASEKQTTQNEWNRIKSEYLQNNAIASGLSISATDYQNAYNNLSIYITPLLMDITSTSNIDGLLFRAIFKSYYDQNIAIVTSIASKQIENIHIGGRNLLRNTAFKENIIGWFSDGAQGAIISWDSIEKAIYLNNGNNGGSILQFISLNPGKYIISFDVKPQFQNQGSSVRIKTSIQEGDFVPIHTTSQFKRYEILFEVLGVATWVAISANGEQRLLFKNIKLEKGNKVTDWTPAPEDIDAQIAVSNANSANALAQAQNAINTANAAAAVTNFLQTTVDGNVVSTGTLQVGDVNGANAMISGVTDQPNGESIRFAAGKPYSQKYLSPFQVLANGLVRFVNPMTGQKTFELGFNQNSGKVVFDIYNDSGIKTASIGPQGIMFSGYIPESYTKRKFRKLTTTTFTKTAIESELIANILQKYAQYGSGGGQTPDSWTQYAIGFSNTITVYEYYEGRNFESADNAQYTGFYTSANKYGEFIADGIYFKQQVRGALYQPSTNMYLIDYYTEAYLFNNGKVTGVIEVGKTIQINSIPNRSTDWSTEDYEQ